MKKLLAVIVAAAFASTTFAQPKDVTDKKGGTVTDKKGEAVTTKETSFFRDLQPFEALRKTVRAAGVLGISVLTIFSFSSENWSRPQSEIRDLLALLRRFIRNDLVELHKSNVRVRVIGERDDLSRDIRALLEEAEDLTKQNDGLMLVVAFNYGARQEIARAARRLAVEVRDGRLSADDITPDLLARHLDEPDLPDPDVIIRTSGEQRLSNFLLWQAAYSELVFVPIYWPDFDRAALESAIAEYHRRERRFGGLIAQTGS